MRTDIAMQADALGTWSASAAATSARIDSIASQIGRATSFVDVLARAQADAGSEARAARSSPSWSSSSSTADSSDAALATVRGSRTVTFGQALSLWGGRAPSSSDTARPVGAGSLSHPSTTGEAWVEGLPPAGRQIAGAIDEAARAEGVDPRLLASLVWAESGFRQGAASQAGATGLTQLMPATARGLGVDASDPMDNLRGGAKYLRIQLDRFGSAGLALAAYNAGPGRVRAAGGIPDIPETQGYVRTVLGHFRDLGGLA